MIQLHQQQLQDQDNDQDVTHQIEEYINLSNATIVSESDMDGTAGEEDVQLLLYNDVDVLSNLTSDNVTNIRNIIKSKSDKPHIIEDEDGVQHEITIEEEQDAIELLTFEDD